MRILPASMSGRNEAIMRVEIQCSDGEIFTLEPTQIDAEFISGLSPEGLAVVIDKSDIESIVEVFADGSREVVGL